MKRKLSLGTMLLVMGAVTANAQQVQKHAALYDSTQVEQLQEVVVKGVRANNNARFAIRNIKKA